MQADPPDALRRIGITIPLLLAPMAGVADADLAIAVARAGGLGAIPAATLAPDGLRAEVARFRAAIDAPLNLNFFCHRTRAPDAAAVDRWRGALAPLHARFGREVPATLSAGRHPFDAAAADLVDALRPAVVSFHFGLPEARLLDRVRATGATVLSSATTVAEARWLAERGADAVIAQGWEAGGHRGMFLDDDIDAQVGTFSLLPQIVDAIDVPVIAAGGIAEARGLQAARVLGAAAVQVGTAFLRCPETRLSDAHRAALAAAAENSTRLTNVFTGRPARGIVNGLMRELGAMSADAPAFPYAGSALSALREVDAERGSADFSPLWAGQGVAIARAEAAERVARRIAGFVD